MGWSMPQEAKSHTNPKVDFFFNRADHWQNEFRQLRAIILALPLTEELKWGVPCYTFQSRNILLMHGFKEYCAVLFMKGALLKDPKRILVQQTENVQAARQIRFTNVRDIVKMKSVLKAYIQQAIDVEKAGLKVDYKRTADYKIPAEFQKRLDANPALRTAFRALTPGRQRAYLFYFSQPKLAKTREARVENCVERILDGMGLND